MLENRRVQLAWILFVGSWGLASCESLPVTNPTPAIPECTGAVAVVVDTGTTPTFTWTPNCTIGRLIVEEGVEERWGTETLGLNTYQSPIRYGVHPPGSENLEPGAELLRGTSYTVTLYRWVTFDPESLQVLGIQTFVP